MFMYYAAYSVTSLNSKTITEILLHWKPASLENSESPFPLQISLA